MSSNKRIHVFYSGHVQGVGFRYTAEDIASGLGLGGWVKNLPDGRVEVISEGEEKKLQMFLDKIESILDRYIRDKSVNWEQATQEFDNFNIRF